MQRSLETGAGHRLWHSWRDESFDGSPVQDTEAAAAIRAMEEEAKTTHLLVIAQVTTAVANGDLSKKITVDVKDVKGEIAELKDTINTMVKAPARSGGTKMKIPIPNVALKKGTISSGSTQKASLEKKNATRKSNDLEALKTDDTGKRVVRFSPAQARS